MKNGDTVLMLGDVHYGRVGKVMSMHKRNCDLIEVQFYNSTQYTFMPEELLKVITVEDNPELFI